MLEVEFALDTNECGLFEMSVVAQGEQVGSLGDDHRLAVPPVGVPGELLPASGGRRAGFEEGTRVGVSAVGLGLLLDRGELFVGAAYAIAYPAAELIGDVVATGIVSVHLLETGQRGVGRLSTRLCLLLRVGDHFRTAAGQPARQRRQGQSLTEQGRQDDNEGEKNDQIPLGKACPSGTTTGRDSTAARDTAPRIPAHAVNVDSPHVA